MKKLREIIKSENDALDYDREMKYIHPENKYSVSIIPRKNGKYITSGSDDKYTPEVQKNRESQGLPGRHGQIIIHHPDGSKVNAGYWMNQPEPHWSYKGVNLADDYWKKPSGKSVWDSLPLQHRLSLELHAQAHSYDPLPKQYEFRKKLEK
jgi:hypothetical protein